MTPVISTDNLADRDDDELDLSQNELSTTISDIGVTDESNDSFFSQVSVRNDLPAGDSVDLPELDSDFENGIEKDFQNPISNSTSFRESVR